MRHKKALAGVAALAVATAAAGSGTASAATASPLLALRTCHAYSYLGETDRPPAPVGMHYFVPSFEFNNQDFYCQLTLNDRVAGVFVLQDALRRCYGQPIAQDSVYGPATVQAVKNVQAFHGLPTDGVYGPATQSRMIWAKFRNSNDSFVRC